MRELSVKRSSSSPRAGQPSFGRARKLNEGRSTSRRAAAVNDDFEPTKPYAPAWVEVPIEFVCNHPR